MAAVAVVVQELLLRLKLVVAAVAVADARA
jgi:hypothetical protein